MFGPKTSYDSRTDGASTKNLADQGKRARRWRIFQAFFVLVYIGIILDILTTAIGVHEIGTQYEQNPIGLGFISGLGWFGLLALVTGLCLVCYKSSRIVFGRMALRWSAILNTVLFCVMSFRWLAVTTAVIFIVHSS